jgi:formylglycine-generating enzyme required for sulfatase activity
MGERGRAADEFQHQVTITRAFAMKVTEVTQAEWQSVMGGNPSFNPFCGGDCPVEMVSWNSAVDYVNRLSDGVGLQRCYDAARSFLGLDCAGFRLPTESEWEYSARSGTLGAYNTGDIVAGGCNDLNMGVAGWYCGNAANSTHPSRQKRVNAWGLYDMHGNVREWVNDWYGAYPAGPVIDPTGAVAGDRRVLRGGGYDSSAEVTRAAVRVLGFPDGFNPNIGFRVAKTL